MSVQPRIRLLRSFDERSHNYLGFALVIHGLLHVDNSLFSVGIGKGTQEKHAFRAGDVVSGVSVPVPDERLEPVQFYRTSELKLLQRDDEPPPPPPPWLGVPPDLPTYRARGHRRLSVRTYDTKCVPCIWGCRMPVEMLIDPWDPHYRYRFETFCYGPKSCAFYKPGPARVVPGRKGMSWVEEDWVDEMFTEQRGPDE